jgi:hypothetical protein
MKMEIIIKKEKCISFSRKNSLSNINIHMPFLSYFAPWEMIQQFTKRKWDNTLTLIISYYRKTYEKHNFGTHEEQKFGKLEYHITRWDILIMAWTRDWRMQISQCALLHHMIHLKIIYSHIFCIVKLVVFVQLENDRDRYADYMNK